MKKETKIQIFSIWGALLFEHKSVDNTIKETLQEAVKQKANLSYSDLRYSDLRGSDLSYSDLRYSDLRGSDLSYSDLRGSNLRGSNLSYSDLRYSDLRGSNLSYSDLRYSKNLDPFWVCDLYSIKMQDPDAKLRFWKFIIDGRSPIQDIGKITYKVGKTYTEEQCDNNETLDCGAGLNVATLQWCLKETINNSAAEFIEVQFKVSDIVAVPYSSDGKFRVRELKVLRRLSRDEVLKEFKELTKWES